MPTTSKAPKDPNALTKGQAKEPNLRGEAGLRRRKTSARFESKRTFRCDVCGQPMAVDAPGWVTLGDGTLLHYGRGKDCIDRHWRKLGIRTGEVAA